jgi:hypothetical protein
MAACSYQIACPLNLQSDRPRSCWLRTTKRLPPKTLHCGFKGNTCGYWLLQKVLRVARGCQWCCGTTSFLFLDTAYLLHYYLLVCGTGRHVALVFIKANEWSCGTAFLPRPHCTLRISLLFIIKTHGSASQKKEKTHGSGNTRPAPLDGHLTAKCHSSGICHGYGDGN